MELTLWTYEGPPHVGAMRIASSMKDIHYVLHAPQGDTYADLLFTMIERRGQRPPVTYTTFQARDLGGDTAELVKKNIKEAVERFKPKTLLVGESCTAELIQDQPGALAKGMGFDMPIVNLELPAYSKKENWGASETFYQLTRTLLKEKVSSSDKINPLRWRELGRRPKVNILGPSLLGFRCRDDVIEIQRILSEQGIDTNVVAPLGASPDDIERLIDAEINICLYQEIAEASGGIHVWHMPALLAIFGDDSCLQFGGGTHGHPWGSAAGAAANRVALEACVKARNAGREIEKESRDILMEAAKHSPELAIALETWKEIKFEFDTVDKLDVQG